MESGVPFSEEEVKLLKPKESLTLVFSQRGTIFLKPSGLDLLVMV